MDRLMSDIQGAAKLVLEELILKAQPDHLPTRGNIKRFVRDSLNLETGGSSNRGEFVLRYLEVHFSEQLESAGYTSYIYSPPYIPSFSNLSREKIVRWIHE
jgi:hypothetical protein